MNDKNQSLQFKCVSDSDVVFSLFNLDEEKPIACPEVQKKIPFQRPQSRAASQEICGSLLAD